MMNALTCRMLMNSQYDDELFSDNYFNNTDKNLRRGVHVAYTCLRRYKMWRLADRNPCDQSQTVVFHPFPVPMTAFVNGLDLVVSRNIGPYSSVILISRMYPNDYRCRLLQSDIWPSRQGSVPQWLVFSIW